MSVSDLDTSSSSTNSDDNVAYLYYYTITNVIPDRLYYVRVRGKNGRGFGSTITIASPVSTVSQSPQPPSIGSFSSSESHGDRLNVLIEAPSSNGGTDILQYNIEWSTTLSFASVLSGTVINTAGESGSDGVLRCPSYPSRSVWEVRVVPSSGSLNGGSFTLDLTHNSQTVSTEPIAYNAVALKSSESVPDNNVYCNNYGVGDCSMTGSVESVLEYALRVAAGCVEQGDDIGDGGGCNVDVSRSGDVSSGFTWSITFLGNGDDFSLSLQSNIVTNSATSSVSVSTIKVSAGKTYAACSGVVEIAGLSTGQEYWVRVSALNSVGYSVAVTSSLSATPMEAPSTPLDVSVSVLSGKALSVSYSKPVSNGGSEINSYIIEWISSDSGASGSITRTNTKLLDEDVSSSSSSLFVDEISGLTIGEIYLIRVYAVNSFGISVSSSAVSVHPYQSPGSAPSLVNVGVTSDTMLTVSFGSPLDVGGDMITKYKIQWSSVDETFSNSDDSYGTVEIMSNTYAEENQLKYYHTITELTSDVIYYVRVSATNSAGYGPYSGVLSASPAFTVPGKPSNIQTTSSSTSSGSGTIFVKFGYPRVPAHGLWCSGITTPQLCPASAELSSSEADGGSVITKYIVSWDTVHTFNSGNSFPHTGENTVNAHPVYDEEPYSTVITGLASGTQYYIRVVAYNQAVGNGEFCGRKADDITGLCSGDLLVETP